MLTVKIFLELKAWPRRISMRLAPAFNIQNFIGGNVYIS
jgi:hypothetical protein